MSFWSNKCSLGGFKRLKNLTDTKPLNDSVVEYSLKKFNIKSYIRWLRGLWTHSLMLIEVGISVHKRANLMGVTSSWGSRSTCACSMSLQKDARRSKGRVSSIMQREISSTSSCFEISSMARYWRSKHIRANSLSWYLENKQYICAVVNGFFFFKNYCQQL